MPRTRSHTQPFYTVTAASVDCIKGDPIQVFYQQSPLTSSRNLQPIRRIDMHTVLVLSKLKKINATTPQPQRNVLIYFAIYKNVAHRLEPGKTPSYSASHQAPNYVQRS